MSQSECPRGQTWQTALEDSLKSEALQKPRSRNHNMQPISHKPSQNEKKHKAKQCHQDTATVQQLRQLARSKQMHTRTHCTPNCKRMRSWHHSRIEWSIDPSHSKGLSITEPSWMAQKGPLCVYGLFMPRARKASTKQVSTSRA